MVYPVAACRWHENIVIPSVPGYTECRSLTVPAGQDNVNMMQTDGVYLYATLNTAPGGMVKIEPNALTEADFLFFNGPALQDNAVDLAIAGGFGYASCATTSAAHSGLIVKVQLSDMTEVATLEAFTEDASRRAAQAIATDGTNLWLASDETSIGMVYIPTRVEQIDLGTFTSVDTLQLSVTDTVIPNSMVVDANTIYCVCRPGGNMASPQTDKIIRIDKTSFTETDVTTAPWGLGNWAGTWLDGTDMYFTAFDGTVWYVNTASWAAPTLVITIPSPTDSAYWPVATVSDLFIANGATPATVYRYNRVTFSAKDSVTFGAGEGYIWSGVAIGTTVYWDISTTPSQFVAMCST